MRRDLVNEPIFGYWLIYIKIYVSNKREEERELQIKMVVVVVVSLRVLFYVIWVSLSEIMRNAMKHKELKQLFQLMNIN